MATAFFLTNTASTIDLGASHDEKKALLVRGAGLTVSTTNSAAGPIGTMGNPCTVSAGGNFLTWFTEKLNAVTIAGTITFRVWMAESNMSANVGAEMAVWRSNDAGAQLSLILAAEDGVEVPVTTRAVLSWTGTPTSTVINAGERLFIRVGGNDIGTQASGFNFTLGYAGVTASADGDSAITFTETITEQPPPGGASPKPVVAPSLAAIQRASRW